MIVKTYAVEPPGPTSSVFPLVDNQQLLLLPLGDIHFMAKEFPADRFKRHIEWGMERGAKFLGMGEFLDFASFGQRKIMGPLRDSTKEMLDGLVQERADELYDLMKVSAGNWIGAIEGDHTWTFQDGTSVDQYLCGLLGCDFLGTSGLVRLKMLGVPDNHPEADTTIFAHHGIGWARLTGSHLHRVEDLTKFIEADVYLMGHTHAKVGAPIDYQWITPDGIHTHRTKVIARTGAWLLGYTSSPPLPLDAPAYKSRGSYVEQKAYVPSALGGLAIGIGYESIEGSQYYRPTIHLSL